MNRRELLKKAGLGLIASASLLTLDFTTPASAHDNQTNFRFMAVNRATTGTTQIIMNGNGKVTPSHVRGGGSFVHFDPAAPGVPKPILHSGTWKAKHLVSFELIGTYGSLASGILEMEVHLVQDFPSRAVIPATLEVICNIPAAGLFTGEEEGFILEAPFGTFVQQTPPVGLSIFTPGNEKRD